MCAFVLDSNRRESVVLGMRSDGDSRYLAFFDECGDHSMEKIDRDFPLFVLALVVMERDLCAHPCARHILNPERTSRAFEAARKHVNSGQGGSGWRVFP